MVGFFKDNCICFFVKGKYSDGYSNIWLSVLLCLRIVVGYSCVRYLLEKLSFLLFVCDELRDGIMNLLRNLNKNLICIWIIG